MNLPLLSVGMGAVLMAQFLSALSDNAILIAAIAIAKKDGTPELIPWLQGAFLVPFILLAPFSGPLADSFPKGRVMLVANLLKLAGASAMALGVNSVLAYALVGIGATMYSPAKYGILSQMFRSELLVRANGMLEGSTIAAILLGVLVGGWLADVSLAWAFGGVIACYALATVSNLLIPRLPAESVSASFTPARARAPVLGRVAPAVRRPDARFSLLGTSVFWGSGTTLRLVLFAWVPVALLLNDNQTPANLMGVLSVGIVAGAAAAGIWISLATVNRALLGGLLLGPMVLAMATVANMSDGGAGHGAHRHLRRPCSWCRSMRCCKNAGTTASGPAAPWLCRTSSRTSPCWFSSAFIRWCAAPASAPTRPSVDLASCCYWSWAPSPSCGCVERRPPECRRAAARRKASEQP
jgi:MFS transporter, LPLT family, lysophospholipid transporter